MPTTGHAGDVWFWRTWALHIHQHGLANVYHSNTDYLPLYHYILWVFVKIQGTSLAIENHFTNLKLITLMFDFGTALILFNILKERLGNNLQALALTLLFALNVAYLYNTMIWFQVDSILAFFVLASVYAAYRKLALMAILLFVLAINFKLQAIVFLPVIGLLLLPQLVTSFSLRNLIIVTGAVAALQLLILLPFWMAGDLDRVWSVISNSTERYPVVAAGAYNMWALFYDETSTSDQGYRGIGLVLFFAFSLAALWPLLRKVFHIVVKREEVQFELEHVLLIGALCGLAFFYFNTQMHERYAHPALLLVAGYSLLTRRFIPYVVISGAYFLNMDQILDHFRVKWLPYDPRVTSIIYLIGIGLLFAELYHVRFKSAKPQSPNSSL